MSGPTHSAPTARHSELLERDSTGRVISASATAGPRGTTPDLWRGYLYSSLGPSATGDVVLHTPGTGALKSSAVQGFDEAVRGAGHRLLSVEVDGTAFELSYDSSGRVATRR